MSTYRPDKIQGEEYKDGETYIRLNDLNKTMEDAATQMDEVGDVDGKQIAEELHEHILDLVG